MSFCLFVCFLRVLWLVISVEVDVDRITILPLPPPDFLSLPNSFFNTSDSYLKSARA